MSKIMVRCYTTDETINPFAIGYIINPSLNCNKVFRVKFEKVLSVSFRPRKMETIIDCLKKKNTCVMALTIIYDNNVGDAKKVYRVLSFVVYYLVESIFV